MFRYFSEQFFSKPPKIIKIINIDSQNWSFPLMKLPCCPLLTAVKNYNIENGITLKTAVKSQPGIQNLIPFFSELAVGALKIMFFVSLAALVWLDVRLIDVTPQTGL